MDRAIEANEVEVVRWMLDNAGVIDTARYRESRIEELRVFPPRCKCGCASLDFEEASGPTRMLADALAIYPDKKMAGLILWARLDRISHLEIYDCHPGASHRFPEITDLRTWERMYD
jgi:hypothetical protein